jgi:hypothetical protein
MEVNGNSWTLKMGELVYKQLDTGDEEVGKEEGRLRAICRKPHRPQNARASGPLCC